MLHRRISYAFIDDMSRVKVRQEVVLVGEMNDSVHTGYYPLPGAPTHAVIPAAIAETKPTSASLPRFFSLFGRIFIRLKRSTTSAYGRPRHCVATTSSRKCATDSLSVAATHV